MHTIKKKEFGIFVLYILLLLPFFGPRGTIIINQTITKIFFTYFPIVISIFIFVSLFKRKKISHTNILIIVFFSYLICITFFKSGDLNSILQTSIKSIGICLLLDYGLKNNTRIFIKSITYLLLILIIINFVTIVLFPNGMYVSDTSYTGNWFLGFRNVHILFIFPAIIFNVINNHLNSNKSKKSNYIIVLFGLLSLALAGSSTSLFGVFCLLVYLLFENKFIFKKINIRFLTIIFLILFFSITIFRLQNIFEYLIVNILNRNLTLTNRIYIWDQVIDYIKLNPIFGYGVEFRNLRLLKTLPISYHAHNQILEIIYQSGFVGFLIFLAGLFSSFRNLQNVSSERISKFLSFSMFVFFVMTITEAYAYDYFIYLLVLCSNINNIIMEEKNENN